MRVTLGMRGDYAVRAMLALATVEGGDRPASVRWIAERMAIPVRFLPHVMTDLSRAGLVVGSPGRRGGYRLGRPAAEISVLQVVDAVDPDGEIPRCVLRGGPCRPDGRCAVHDVFAGATRALRESLSAQSLAEIAVPGAPGIELEPR
ncbi:MAG TPA: Rrf2 family transcriptional regulator [Candidatus Limnocylindrales bacterium]|nr:Rrf2 family transcriptional regulator [Candidatus Limnocylindrales bacterium]